jgi:hypothetical protein
MQIKEEGRRGARWRLGEGGGGSKKDMFFWAGVDYSHIHTHMYRYKHIHTCMGLVFTLVVAVEEEEERDFNRALNHVPTQKAQTPLLLTLAKISTSPQSVCVKVKSLL